MLGERISSSALPSMHPHADSLPERITIAQAAALAGYRRKSTIREKFLSTHEHRAQLGHRYSDLGESTIDTKRFLAVLGKERSDREKRGNWRLVNLELANEARQRKRAKTVAAAGPRARSPQGSSLISKAHEKSGRRG